MGIAPSVALLLLWRGIGRGLRETPRPRRIALATLAALTLWMVASNFMLDLVFGTTWGLAHARPLPDGFFPEGWPIYGWLAAYSTFGSALVWALRKLPPRQTER